MSLEAGQITELAAGVRRLLAPNPSMMTGPGTNTYLLGSKEIAVIDPGPAMPKHVDAIQELADAPIKWILVTHTHPDHCQRRRCWLKLPALNNLAGCLQKAGTRTRPSNPITCWQTAAHSKQKNSACR